MASASSLPAGGMWRAAPAKAAKISRGELSQYRSRSSLNGGGRPLAIARAIRLACSSVGDDLVGLDSRASFRESRNVTGEPHLSLVEISEIHPTQIARVNDRRDCGGAEVRLKLKPKRSGPAIGQPNHGLLPRQHQ